MTARRTKGSGSVRWIEERRRWRIRATRPSTPHSPAKRVDRWLQDPAKYERLWPSAAGRKAAERALAELTAELSADAARSAERETPTRAVTLDRFVESRWHPWLDENTVTEKAPGRKYRPKSADEYRLVYAKRIAPVLGHRKVGTLVPSDVDALVRSLTAPTRKPKPLAEASLRRTIVVLRGIVKVAERDGLLAPGTARRFELTAGLGHGAAPKAAPEATEEQMRTLLRLCLGRALRSPTAVALMVATVTGCRRSEALGLRWSDVDWEAGTVTISRGWTETPKGTLFIGPTKAPKSSVRTVPLPTEVLRTLREVRKARPGTEYLAEGLRTPGRPTRPSQAARAGGRLIREAGIEEGGWNTPRHGWESAAYARGESPLIVAKHAGHTPEVSLKHYAGKLAEPVRELGERMGELLSLEPEAEAG